MPEKKERTISVKLNSSRAGHRFNDKGQAVGTFSQKEGDIVNMPVDEANRYIESGLADLVSSSNK